MQLVRVETPASCSLPSHLGASRDLHAVTGPPGKSIFGAFEVRESGTPGTTPADNLTANARS